MKSKLDVLLTLIAFLASTVALITEAGRRALYYNVTATPYGTYGVSFSTLVVPFMGLFLLVPALLLVYCALSFVSVLHGKQKIDVKWVFNFVTCLVVVTLPYYFLMSKHRPVDEFYRGASSHLVEVPVSSIIEWGEDFVASAHYRKSLAEARANTGDTEATTVAIPYDTLPDFMRNLGDLWGVVPLNGSGSLLVCWKGRLLDTQWGYDFLLGRASAEAYAGKRLGRVAYVMPNVIVWQEQDM